MIEASTADAEDQPSDPSIRRFTDKRIVAVLRQTKAGTPAIEVCRRRGATETTFHRSCKEYQGVSSLELRELELLRVADVASDGLLCAVAVVDG